MPRHDVSEALKRFAFRRRDRLVTTWKLRVVLLTIAALIIWSASGFLIRSAANSLICDDDRRPADLILIDNSDPDYLSFETAASLRNAGVASRVAVFVEADGTNPAVPSMVSAGVADVMSRIAWLGEHDVIPVEQREPITLNVAYQVRAYMIGRELKSVVIAVPAFRSQRTMLIYDAVMRENGIRVGCAPVFSRMTAAVSTSSWHALQGVAEQFLKLQYYRFAVLPFLSKYPAPQQAARGH